MSWLVGWCLGRHRDQHERKVADDDAPASRLSWIGQMRGWTYDGRYGWEVSGQTPGSAWDGRCC